MSYVAYVETKSAEQREADRQADIAWQRDHRPLPLVAEVDNHGYYRPGVMSLTTPSAH